MFHHMGPSALARNEKGHEASVKCFLLWPLCHHHLLDVVLSFLHTPLLVEFFCFNSLIFFFCYFLFLYQEIVSYLLGLKNKHSSYIVILVSLIHQSHNLCICKKCILFVLFSCSTCRSSIFASC